MLIAVMTYIGTILIGFEVLQKITYANNLLLWLVKPFAPFLNGIKFRGNKTKIPNTQQMRFTPWIIARIIIFIPLALVFGTTAYLIFFVSSLLRTINAMLNNLARSEAKSIRPFLKEISSVYVKKSKTRVTPNQIVNQSLETEIPFVGIAGIVLLTIGFILDIRG